MTVDALLARRAKLEEELAALNREISFQDCAGEGRCHGCACWCDTCGDVAIVCDSSSCDRHYCNDIGCRRKVENPDHVVEGYGWCPEHHEP